MRYIAYLSDEWRTEVLAQCKSLGFSSPILPEYQKWIYENGFPFPWNSCPNSDRIIIEESSKSLRKRDAFNKS
jgi:hypothetical protein